MWVLSDFNHTVYTVQYRATFICTQQSSKFMTLYINLRANLLCCAFSIDYSTPEATEMKMKNTFVQMEPCWKLVNINLNSFAFIRDSSNAWAYRKRLKNVEP